MGSAWAQFFAVNGYLLLLVVPLRSIGMWVGQYQRAMASGERIFEVLDYDRDILDRPDAEVLGPGPGGIHMEGVASATTPTRPCWTASTWTCPQARRSP